MVSVLDSGSSDPGSRPGWDHCAVFLGKTLYSLRGRKGREGNSVSAKHDHGREYGNACNHAIVFAIPPLIN